MSMCLRLSLHERERGIPVVRAAQSTPTAQPVDTIGPPVHWNAITIQPHSSDGNTAAGDSCVHCALFCTERVRLSARNRPSLAPTGSPGPPHWLCHIPSPSWSPREPTGPSGINCHRAEIDSGDPDKLCTALTLNSNAQKFGSGQKSLQILLF